MSATAIDAGVVATCIYERRRWTAVGRTKGEASRRLERTIDRTFNRRIDLPAVAHVDYVEDVSAEQMFYVEFCYNGEDPTADGWAEFVDEADPEDVWGNDWREQLADALDG